MPVPLEKVKEISTIDQKECIPMNQQRHASYSVVCVAVPPLGQDNSCDGCKSLVDGKESQAGAGEPDSHGFEIEEVD